MNRSDRNRYTRLDRILSDRARAIKRAEDRALHELAEIGYKFTTPQQALAFQAKVRNENRAQAELVTADRTWRI